MDAPIKISVRDLVEFLLRSGSIDNRTPGGSPDAALAGIRMHQKLQEEAGEEGYRAEVSIGLDWTYGEKRGGGSDAASLDVCGQIAGLDEVAGAPVLRGSLSPADSAPAPAAETLTHSDSVPVPAAETLSPADSALTPAAETLKPADSALTPAAETLTPVDSVPPLCVRIEGRMDGLYRDAESGIWVVDEIKTTYRSLKGLREPQPLHLAQAKCYAFFWGLQLEEGLQQVGSSRSEEAPQQDEDQHHIGDLHRQRVEGLYHLEGLQRSDEVRVGVRVTYGNLLTERTRRFRMDYSMQELRAWFSDLMEQYRPWAEFRRDWARVRTDSIHALSFPYPYRPGQKELAAAVYRTIVHGRRLFLEAPTGTGKTLSVLFPAVKAMGEGKADRLFYLTARTTTGAAAEQALDLLRGQGLRAKSVTLTAKEKVCPMEQTDCNPEGCPRAWGHYDRVNASMYALLTREDAFTREAVQRVALEFQVCPYELSLDISRYADVVIGDYNYLFDPRAYLRRFFTAADEMTESVNAKKNDLLPGIDFKERSSAPAPSSKTGDRSSDLLGAGGAQRGSMRHTGEEYLFLIDEAHNLVERGRQMYSAGLVREDVLSLRRKVKDLWPGLYRALGRCSRVILPLKKAIQEGRAAAAQQVLQGGNQAQMGEGVGAMGARPRDGAPGPLWGRDCIAPADVSGVIAAAAEVDAELAGILTKERIAEQTGKAAKDPLRTDKKAVWDELLNFYYELEHFLDMGASLDDHYVSYAQLLPDGRFLVRLYCMDPSRRLRACMERGRSAILFSATLLPITYYKALLGGTRQDYEIYAQSVFDPRKMGLYVVRDVTSRYRDRTRENYGRIARCIMNVLSQRHGNYMVFFPSYAFLREVEERMTQYPGVREAGLTENTQAPTAGEAGLTENTQAPTDNTAVPVLTQSRDIAFMDTGLLPAMYEDTQALAAGEKTDLPEADAEDGRILTQTDCSRLRKEGIGAEVMLLRQRPNMKEEEREEFLARFQEPREDESLVGLCVSGGIFGEGIDLQGNSLIGVIVVGTGVPQVCLERELLKAHFDSDGGNGYDYAYRFPGMNRVQQAAGRVIRTKEDVGIVVLMDERFAWPEYRRLYPREWSGLRITDSAHIAHEVERFWDEWL